MRDVLLWVGLCGVPSVALAKPDPGWICDAEVWEDTVCDCGCAVVDVDCATADSFTVCERSQCGAGEVPWEHRPWTCMTSACGDGWRDEAAGELCDDGEALNRGGCSRDCLSVNEGWECGAMAQGCWEVKIKPKPKPKPEPKPEPSDTGEPAQVDDGASGCRTAPSSPGWALPLLLGLLARRRWSAPASH